MEASQHVETVLIDDDYVSVNLHGALHGTEKSYLTIDRGRTVAA